MVNAFRGTSTWLFHLMVGSEMIARRSMLPMSRALFFPDAKGRCVMNRQTVIERLRRKRPRKMSGWHACFRALMFEAKAVSRSGPWSSQGLKEKILAQHVKLFNALSPSDKEGWETIATDLSCEHARDIKQDVQHDVEAINLLISRARAERARPRPRNLVSIFLYIQTYKYK